MLKYYVADAFADEVFEGNPAGVCILDEWLSEDLMKKIAMENNLSETAFAVKEDERSYGLRWFTPVGEIDLCGHATFGTAFVLFRFEEQMIDTLHFHAKKCGHHLIVAKNGDMLAMRFPTIAPERYAYAEYMGEGMGAVPSEVYRTERDLLLVYDSEETIRNLKPDFAKLKEFPVGLSVYVTAKSSGNDYDIVARAFWPKINVNEDPVCGTMYCTLMPFWRERLGKDTLVARQLSARGGTVYCSYNGDSVGISGRGALYSVGTIFVNGSNEYSISKINTTDTAELCEISVDNKRALGISVNIPGTELQILQIRCRKGMLFCRVFDTSVIEKFQFPAAIFSAPKFEDMLKNNPIHLSKAAVALGATADMTGRELVKLFS